MTTITGAANDSNSQPQVRELTTDEIEVVAADKRKSAATGASSDADAHPDADAQVTAAR